MVVGTMSCEQDSEGAQLCFLSHTVGNTVARSGKTIVVVVVAVAAAAAVVVAAAAVVVVVVAAAFPTTV